MVWNPFDCSSSPQGGLPPTLSFLLGEKEDGKEKVLECDYERNCSPLYKRMETGEWDVVAVFLDTGFWPNHFYADSIPPADQARTWVTRMDYTAKQAEEEAAAAANKETDEDGADAAGTPKSIVPKILWSQLPLHLAIVVDAPLGIVRRLVNLYPSSVRCTDDEHMLPLHLALRHAAPDNVVDFLLQAFPDAVNARGKHQRSALECAMRSRKKARARIIQIFVERTRVASTSNQLGPIDRDNSNKSFNKVKHLLFEKDRELEELHDHLIVLESEKNTVELDLEKKVEELTSTRQQLEQKAEELNEAKKSIEWANKFKLDQYQTSRELGELAEVKRIEILEASKKELEESEKRIRQDEAVLRKDLEAIEVCIAKSFDKDDLNNLKQEVENLKARRLAHTRERVIAEMDMLKETLKANLETNVEGRSNQEIVAMQNVLEGLSSTNFQDQTPDDLIKFRTELAKLKDELRRKREAGKTRSELAIIQRSFNNILRNTEIKPEDVQAIKKALETLEPSKLEHMTLEQLQDTKEKARSVKKSVQSREFLRQTKRDLAEIHISIEKLLRSTPVNGIDEDSATSRKDLERMMAVLEKMSVPNLETKGKEDILAIRMDMAVMREELRHMEIVAKLKRELQSLRMDLTMQLKNSQGKDRKEVLALRKNVEDMLKSSLELKNYDDLQATTNALQAMQLEHLKRKEIEQIKTKLEHMRTILTKQLRDSDGKSKTTVLALKKELSTIMSLRREVKKKPEKIDEIKHDMESLTFQMAKTEEEINTKAQLDELKKQIDQALESAEGEMKHDLRIMKRTVASIDLDEIEMQATDEWKSLKNELQGLKLDLKKKDLRAIKQNLVARLNDPKEFAKMSTEEAKAVQDAVNLLDLDVIEKASAYELDGLKKDVQFILDFEETSSLAKKGGTESQQQQREQELQKQQQPKQPQGMKKIFSLKNLAASFVKKRGKKDDNNNNGADAGEESDNDKTVESAAKSEASKSSKGTSGKKNILPIFPPKGLTKKTNEPKPESDDNSEPDPEEVRDESIPEPKQTLSTLSTGAPKGGDGSGRPIKSASSKLSQSPQQQDGDDVKANKSLIGTTKSDASKAAAAEVADRMRSLLDKDDGQNVGLGPSQSNSLVDSLPTAFEKNSSIASNKSIEVAQ